ncbi:SsrA-binding protein SmpB [Flaviaesturariibacter amylovorans]|uniref:SsrA-binding protein n=1 Tax=Flaviaesturariibacter amylovorans TaxID=1084520 RepID=A0ABP8GJ55_9BACT
MARKNKAIEIRNRSAWHEYFVDDTWVAGVALLGTEVKSLRAGKASFNDSYCLFNDGELWLKSLHIAEYVHGTVNNHDPLRDRKLLLTKRELKKMEGKLKEKGYTVIPLRIFTNDKSLIKMEIGLARGKKLYDKRESIKARDTDRDLKRYLK